ncbi:MAG: hypothetical protein AAF702_02595 [Chloroflexota bacterium]
MISPIITKIPSIALIIAQAMCDEIVLITRDPDFSNYEVELAWAEPEPPSLNGSIHQTDE